MRIASLTFLIACLLTTTVRAEMNKMCPVMTDQPTREDRFVDYQGKRIYFCCDKCMARFQREPTKFIANLDPANTSAAVTQTLAPVKPPLGKSLAQLFGRLHVVVVHFPIALILLAGLIELVRIRKSNSSDMARLALTLGAVAALIAAGMGWVDAANQFPGAAPRH